MIMGASGAAEGTRYIVPMGFARIAGRPSRDD